MSKNNNTETKNESIFLSDQLMTTACALVVVTSIICLVFIPNEGDSFNNFEILIKLSTTIAMYLAYRNYSWDVAKGLMGGVLFCIMYQEAYLVLGKLWGEEDFDTYLIVGVQGSIYLAAAGMSFLMTIIITLNHFLINYARHGNPENVILNRMAISFKFVVYLLLLIANSKLGFTRMLLWKNAFQYLNDMSIFLLLVSIESQFDSFKQLHQELLAEKRERRKNNEHT
ncbi:hypothetical protein [Butyrivibrio sp. VCD2006]|uniref:hypothetical protein n=1 Tax=Butyrivibrio sp. VCD2006 TaxID=1280664 RepID=UPI0012DF500B|nr:hypothetical protein [Butyrivibrio sp. VCD2006]